MGSGTIFHCYCSCGWCRHNDNRAQEKNKQIQRTKVAITLSATNFYFSPEEKLFNKHNGWVKKFIAVPQMSRIGSGQELRERACNHEASTTKTSTHSLSPHTWHHLSRLSSRLPPPSSLWKGSHCRNWCHVVVSTWILFIVQNPIPSPSLLLTIYHQYFSKQGWY